MVNVKHYIWSLSPAPLAGKVVSVEDFCAKLCRYLSLCSGRSDDFVNIPEAVGNLKISHNHVHDVGKGELGVFIDHPVLGLEVFQGNAKVSAGICFTMLLRPSSTFILRAFPLYAPFFCFCSSGVSNLLTEKS